MLRATEIVNETQIFVTTSKATLCGTSLRENNEINKTRVILGREKFNEMGAYLELCQMIGQTFQEAMKHRTGPRLIKCLLEEKERKFPNADVKASQVRSRSEPHNQYQVMTEFPSVRKLLSIKLGWHIYFHFHRGD